MTGLVLFVRVVVCAEIAEGGCGQFALEFCGHFEVAGIGHFESVCLTKQLPLGGGDVLDSDDSIRHMVEPSRRTVFVGSEELILPFPDFSPI